MDAWRSLPFFPEQASTGAGRVDLLYFFLIAVSLFFAVLIFSTILWFAIRYRARPGKKAEQIDSNLLLEITWTVIPLCLTMIMFGWGAKLFLRNHSPPAGAMPVYVVGKQWMWKFQHPEGRYEINALHVPVGRPVLLTMISEDVIHDLFVPAFRVKQDVLPARYTQLWFQATKTGTYHLFCSQYCGTQHSKMGGYVTVMEPADYAQWLVGTSPEVPMAEAGGQLFQRYGCAACHQPDGAGRGPSLADFFGKRIRLQDGTTVTGDENYFRTALFRPEKAKTAGYPPIMPTYQGSITEEGVQQLMAYLRSAGHGETVRNP